MRKFRLLWARQCGERKAKEYGYDRFPIDPFAIAKKENILVEAKRPEQVGVSGGIIIDGENAGIFYSTTINSRGFQRFTVAHELGHYFLEDHPHEIQKTGGVHISRAGFTQGDVSIELEADHFASGLLLPRRLVSEALGNEQIGLQGIENLAGVSQCSLTASAIRAAECSPYPMAIVVSSGECACYAFMSDGFKRLGKLTFLRKGAQLPLGITRSFNADPDNVLDGRRVCGQATVADWFEGPKIPLDEEVVGLGSYGLTLTVLSSDALSEDPEDEEEEDASLIESYTPRFAYGR